MPTNEKTPITEDTGPEIKDWSTHISTPDLPGVKVLTNDDVVRSLTDGSPSNEQEAEQVSRLDVTVPEAPTVEDEEPELMSSIDVLTENIIPDGLDVTDVDLNTQDILENVVRGQKSNSVGDDSTVMLDGIPVPLKSAEQYYYTLRNLAQTTPNNEFKSEFNTPESQAARCRDVFDHFVANTELQMSELKKRKAEIAEAEHLEEVTLDDIFSGKVQNVGSGISRGQSKLSNPNKTLSGADAILAFKNSFVGLRVVPLWNTGIKITITGCDMATLAGYFNSIQTAGYEYGRELGGYYFMYIDYDVKRHVLKEILPKVLVSSTYKHWNKIDRLLNVIKLPDYDVILWAIYAMIAKDGTPLNFLDTDGKIATNHQYTADVSKMRMVDARRIPHDAISFMSTKAEGSVTDMDLAKYEAMFDIENKYWFQHTNHANGTTSYWCFEHQQATCARYLEAGSVFNGALYDAIHHPDKDQVATFMGINYYRAYIPWIKCLYQVSEASYNSRVISPDETYFKIFNNDLSKNNEFWEILGTQHMEDTDYGNFVIDYIRRCRITHILIQVPKTLDGEIIKAQEIESGVDGFIPFDIQNHFFLTCLMRMQKPS